MWRRLKISRRTQRAPTYECVWHRVLNARLTTSRRAADVHQRMTTNDKKSSYAGIRRAHTLICDGHFKENSKINKNDEYSIYIYHQTTEFALNAWGEDRQKKEKGYCYLETLRRCVYSRAIFPKSLEEGGNFGINFSIFDFRQTHLMYIFLLAFSISATFVLLRLVMYVYSLVNI